MKHEKYMQRCIELALNGKANVAPNPMVGAVIVYEDVIIGEGFHQNYGSAHAEVIAINSVKDKSLLKKSTLYVNLEPCNHHGKTPPCSELIKKYNIPNVVVGCIDPNPLVANKGIQNLKDFGIHVTTSVLENECKELNTRFMYFYEKKRPFIILKWAQSSDGFIGDDKKGNVKISNTQSHQLLHKWRAEESAIMIGTNTALIDNPSLTVRNYSGKNPLRLVIDKHGRLPKSLKLLNGEAPTVVFSNKLKKDSFNLTYIKLNSNKEELGFILQYLFKNGFNSLIVEGGAKLLQSFINQNLWDEARVFHSGIALKKGIKAPSISGEIIAETTIINDRLIFLKNKITNPIKIK